MFRDFGAGQKWDPCLGIFYQKPTHLGGTSPYSFSMGVPPRVSKHFVSYDIITAIIERGITKSTDHQKLLRKWFIV